MTEKFKKLTGLAYPAGKLQTKLSELKKKYEIWNAIRENSGFGWNEAEGRPTASFEVWRSYIDKHPKAKEFQFNKLENWQELEEIFTGRFATGNYAVSSFDIIEIDNKEDNDEGRDEKNHIQS